MPTKKMDAKRAAKAARREQEAAKLAAHKAEKRKSWLLAGAALGVGVLLIAIVVIREQTKPTPIGDRALTALGVSAKAANCAAVTSPKVEAKGTVPAKNKAGKATVVKYKNVPPSSGKSFATGAPSSTTYYAPGSGPAPETLVRNLQNGYTVLWYDPALPQKQLDQLTYVGDKGAVVAQSGKFIVAPWDTKRGAFPAGKKVALTAWGHTQFCAGINGKAISSFIDNHPPSGAPTPTGA